jgi:hypothetical protein
MSSRNSFGDIYNKLTIIELVLIMIILGMVIYLMYRSFKPASSFGAAPRFGNGCASQENKYN